MGLDGIAAEHFVALEDDMEALAADILALVLKAAFSKDDYLAENLHILELVQVLLEQFVHELQSSNRYLRLSFSFDRHLSSVAKHSRRTDEPLVPRHLQQNILSGLAHTSILVADPVEQVVEKSAGDEGTTALEGYLGMLS